MNKSEIISAIGKDQNLTDELAEKFIKSLILIVTKALKDGKKILIARFISISKIEKRARLGRNS